MADREDTIRSLRIAISDERSTKFGGYGFVRLGIEEAVIILNMLEEQEAKTGYWIDSAGNDKCSICGAEYSDLYPDYGNTHFCPNCGAKMKGR